MKAPDFEHPYALQVDASDRAVGAVLLQNGKDGIYHPVCYMSQKLKLYQFSYSTVGKELMTVLLSSEKFDVYLNNPKFPIDVYSDHNPLQFVHKMKGKNQRLTRWALALQPYTKHIKASENLIADLLSRS